MDELSPHKLERQMDAPEAPDDLAGEVVSTLGLIGSVLLLVALISLFGRL